MTGKKKTKVTALQVRQAVSEGLRMTKKQRERNIRRRLGASQSGGWSGRFTGGGGKERKFVNFGVRDYQIDQTAEFVPNTALFQYPESGVEASKVGAAHLTQIPQGISGSSRIGRKCSVKSIQGKLKFDWAPGYSTPSLMWTTVRVALIQDTQCNGAIPPGPVTQESQTPAPYQSFESATTLPNALSNLYCKGRYKILWDKQFVFQMSANNQTTGTTVAPLGQGKNFSFFKRCNIPLEFDTTNVTGEIASLRSNGVFIAAGADNADDGVRMTATIRIRFDDD